ncbi:MAG: ABC transporter permease [Phycisphaeraceae bacterium]|nr:ABC transporter permease [Phycisphaeraceae bacterium]
MTADPRWGFPELCRILGLNEPEQWKLLTTPQHAIQAATQAMDRRKAAGLMLDLVEQELSGRSRVLYLRPTLKWPDLGTSLRGRPVGQLLAESVPITLLLNALTIPIIYGIAIFAGIHAARRRGQFLDVGSGVVMLGLWSIPVMWTGVMLIGFLASKQYIHLFPTAGLHDVEAESMAFLPRMTADGFSRGWLLDMTWHLVLPVFCMSYGGFAVLSKLTRGSLLENIRADYVRTARAKGVSENDVLYRHVFRNSLLPLITVVAAILPSLFAGALIVENIFSIQGMGKLGVDAAFMKDRELVMGTTLLGGLLGLGSELLRDLLYAMADPRVSYE